ncbi:phosphoethanolamine--lipid A transferase [Pararhizobium sp. BT-229]|uniref:phosphoethanolamine transferase n=1 Tax=Pararhizobium sp. BT-229 TaxID=2986923 RepID=UPI0021F7B95B|nr:phosphoethanolamine--lipid A transferase [Pararhizobium sp. BT-229]MCV9967591.1 phosphoethanolamine--lipid A transferase [Pararhizobium sp. BT-229]
MSLETLSTAPRLTRPAIGSATLSVIVALYLVVVANRTFWTKAVDYLGVPSFALVLLGIGLFALFSAICVAVSVKYLTKPLFILLIMSAAAASRFMDHFGTIIDVDMIRNAAETTGSEAGHLLTAGFVMHMALFGVLPSVLIALVRIRHRPFFQKFKWNLAVVLSFLAVFVSVSLANVRTFAATTREHRDLVATLNPVLPIVSAVRYVMASEGEKNIVVQPLGTDAHVVAPTVSGKPRVTVIVAGETARAENFSLGGYARDTNPELARQDIRYFTDTSSCGTATAVSLPCMFSIFTRRGYTHEKGLETENLVDVLSHASIRTEWWDNNTGSKAVAKRIAYTSFSDINDPRFCKDHECIDAVHLDRLGAWLDAVKGDSVLVIHQIGSHGPAYFQRYPDAFRKFTPDCRTAELGNCSRDEIVNAYDNTILYTDHVLSTVIDMLKAREDRMAGSMIYMSDHGESLGEHGLYLHGAPYFIAPSQQTHVPFVLWLGGQAKAGIDAACLAHKTGEPQSHDNLFHTVLGMLNVATKVYDPALDVLASCRGGAAAS